MSAVLTTATTTALAVTTVALWTARVTLTARGRSGFAAILAAIEATVFVSVVARLMGDLDDPVQLVAYAVGVAAGTTSAVRMLRALQPTVVRVDGVVPGSVDHLLAVLHTHGWPTTTSLAHGLRGPATTVSITTTANRLPGLYAILDQSDTAAFWTETEVRSVREGTVPAGFVQTASSGRRRAPGRDGPRTGGSTRRRSSTSACSARTMWGSPATPAASALSAGSRTTSAGRSRLPGSHG